MVTRQFGIGAVVAVLMTGAAEATDLARCEPGTAERIRFIEDRLEERRPYATMWWHGWTGTYAVGTVVQSVRAGLEDSEGKKADLVVSAVKALIGTTRLMFEKPIAGMWFDVPSARFGAEPASSIEPTDESACRERLAVDEDLLRKSAKESESRWDWKRHAGNVAFNVAGGLIVAYGFDDETRGWRSAGVGIGVGEAMIFSRPWKADDDLAEYEQRFNGASAPRTSVNVLPWRGGARLVLAF
jgi:hypothetical protein